VNWPHIVIGAGISAWVHGLVAAACESLGLHAFATFGLVIGIASALTFGVGLIVRGCVESNRRDEEQHARYAERLKEETARVEGRFEAWRKHVTGLDERLKKLEQAKSEEAAE